MLCVASGESCGGSDVSGCVVGVVAGLEGSSNFSVISSSAEVGIFAVKTASDDVARCRGQRGEGLCD